MRARYPDASGFVDGRGARPFHEVDGTCRPTIVPLPSAPIVQSRILVAEDAVLSAEVRDLRLPLIPARHPVRANLLIRDVVRGLPVQPS
ncbi:MAG TPA: hypothetical protein VH720_12975 [Candidatus Limnocylindrales bacterium]